MQTLLPTSLVGSYPQPDWLIDREKLAGRFPPRIRVRELWRVPPEWLEQAQDDATILAIREQERAGLDIITDGEMRRESYSNRFATALEGVDIDNPGTALDRSGHPNPVPRVVGKIRRKHPVQVRDLQFLRAHTTRQVKMTVPGAFTMTQQVQNDYYKSEEALAMDYAAAVNEEIKDLFAAGADIVQMDEPYMQARPEKARQYGVAALQRALDGVTGTTAVTSASDMRPSFMNGHRDIHSCRNWRSRMRGRSRSRLLSPRSIVRYSRNCAGRPSSWACWTSRLIKSKRRKQLLHEYDGRFLLSQRSSWWLHRTADSNTCPGMWLLGR